MEPTPKPLLLEMKCPESPVICMKCFEDNHKKQLVWKAQKVHDEAYQEALIKLGQKDELDNEKDVLREMPLSPPMYPKTRS